MWLNTFFVSTTSSIFVCRLEGSNIRTRIISLFFCCRSIRVSSSDWLVPFRHPLMRAYICAGFCAAANSCQMFAYRSVLSNLAPSIHLCISVSQSVKQTACVYYLDKHSESLFIYLFQLVAQCFFLHSCTGSHWHSFSLLFFGFFSFFLSSSLSCTLCPGKGNLLVWVSVCVCVAVVVCVNREEDFSTNTRTHTDTNKQTGRPSLAFATGRFLASTASAARITHLHQNSCNCHIIFASAAPFTDVHFSPLSSAEWGGGRGKEADSERDRGRESKRESKSIMPLFSVSGSSSSLLSAISPNLDNSLGIANWCQLPPLRQPMANYHGHQPWLTARTTTTTTTGALVCQCQFVRHSSSSSSYPGLLLRAPSYTHAHTHTHTHLLPDFFVCLCFSK